MAKAGITKEVIFEPRRDEGEVVDDVGTCTKNVVRGDGLSREYASRVQGQARRPVSLEKTVRGHMVGGESEERLGLRGRGSQGPDHVGHCRPW